MGLMSALLYYANGLKICQWDTVRLNKSFTVYNTFTDMQCFICDLASFLLLIPFLLHRKRLLATGDADGVITVWQLNDALTSQGARETEALADIANVILD